MANIYTSKPSGLNRLDYDNYDEYPKKKIPPEDVYSIAEITFKDGSRTEFMVKASPSVVPHLTKEMKNTGYLTLWNDTDTLSIAASEVKYVCLRQITSEK